jgi:hypothetical protein
MEYSRRHLFRVGQALLVATAMPKSAFSGESGEKSFPLTQKGFAPLVNASFRVQFDSGVSRWFTLLSIEDMTPNAQAYETAMVMPRHLKIPSPRTETFALHFQSTGEALRQGTYVFENENTGRLPLFIVPSGDLTYIATVNLLIQS